MTVTSQPSFDALWQAMDYMGRSLSWSLSKPPTDHYPAIDKVTTTLHQRITLIADHNRLRARLVTLEGQWSKQDHGDLLVFRSGKPYVLSLNRYGAYRVIDPDTRRSIPLSKKNNE